MRPRADNHRVVGPFRGWLATAVVGACLLGGVLLALASTQIPGTGTLQGWPFPLQTLSLTRGGVMIPSLLPAGMIADSVFWCAVLLALSAIAARSRTIAAAIAVGGALTALQVPAGLVFTAVASDLPPFTQFGFPLGFVTFGTRTEAPGVVSISPGALLVDVALISLLVGLAVSAWRRSVVSRGGLGNGDS
jgi:hypothetical protein